MLRSTLVALVLLPLLGACSQTPAASPPRSVLAAVAPAPTPAPPASRPPPDDRRVYRFDFVLTRPDDAGDSPVTFSITLMELDTGEVRIGKNVPLEAHAAADSAPPQNTAAKLPPPAKPTSFGSPRMDVGTKVHARFRTLGEDILLDVSTEMSEVDSSAHPSPIRKVTTVGNALTAAGKPTTIMTVNDGRQSFQLTVTPTKLR